MERGRLRPDTWPHAMQSWQPDDMQDMQPCETYQKKISEMEVSKSETCLWKLKFGGSSTMTINKQKHIHKM